MEQEGIVLDENQVAALEKAKEEKQAHGEIETYYPGFLVAWKNRLVKQSTPCTVVPVPCCADG